MTFPPSRTDPGAEAHPEPATAVVEAVARATDADPLDLAPLSEVVDPDALNGLLSRSLGAV